MQADAVPIDSKTFWRAIGCRAVGAAVVTARDAEGPAGFLALSATHLSADPPRLMASIDQRTSALRAVRNGRHFAINYLRRGQDEMAQMFGGKGELKGADRFQPGLWAALVTGAPTLIDAVGVLDCALEEIIERETASIVIGRLVGHAASADAAPLISFRGGFM